MRFVALMGQVLPKIVEKFRAGGGLSYDDYPSFHALWLPRARLSTTPR